MGEDIVLYTFSAVNKYRSVRRAFRRGHVDIYGRIYPKRPFNNRKSFSNIRRQKVYERLAKNS